MDAKRLRKIKRMLVDLKLIPRYKMIDELIEAVEASFIAVDAAKLFMEKAEKERDEAQAELAGARLENKADYQLHLSDYKDLRKQLADMEVERIALEHRAAHVESELAKQLAASRAEVERFNDDEVQNAKAFGKLVNENTKLKAENKAIEEHIAEHGV